MLFPKNHVLLICIFDKIKEIIQGELYQKLKVAACQLKQLKPYNPWSKAAEREFNDLKKGIGCKLLLFRESKYLWNDCLELEADVRSNTAHDIYKLGISKFSKLESFQDETAPFLEEMIKLGHYLGPSIDVGSAMMAEILTQNGQLFHTSTYRLLTPAVISDQEGSDINNQFMTRVNKRLGFQVFPRDLEDIRLGNTPN